MRRVTLKVLTVAATLVAPHLISRDDGVSQVRQIERLSAEERVAMKEVSEIAVYREDEASQKDDHLAS